MSSDKKTGHEIPNGHVPRQGALAARRKNLEKYFLPTKQGHTKR